MNVFNLINDIEKVDPEVFERFSSRRSMFGKAGKFAGNVALAAVPFALGSMFKKAYGQTPNDVINTLNFALTLEYLEDDFYKIAISTGNLIPSVDKPIFMQISKHETAHVAFLRTTISSLGATPVSKPTFDFSGGNGSGNGPYKTAFSDYSLFLTVSQALEDTGVRAYKGQAANLINNNAVLTAALQIHSVEARHAAEVRRLRGQKGWITGNNSDGAPQAIYNGEENTNQGGVTVPNSAAFDEPLTTAEVLAIVDPFIV